MATPSRLVIILGRQSSIVSYVLRADVPVGQEEFYKQPGAVSPTGNGTDPDLPGLVAGSIAQSLETMDIPANAGESGPNYKTRSQALLVAQQVAYQARITVAVPKQFFGAFWNGTSWANTGG